MREWRRFRSACWTALLMPFLFLPYRWLWLPGALAASALLGSGNTPLRPVLKRDGTIIFGSLLVLIVRCALDPLWWVPWAAFLGLILAWRARYSLKHKALWLMLPVVWIASYAALHGFSGSSGVPMEATGADQVLVCAGDSLTSGVDIRSDAATYVARLRERLKGPVINAGVANDKARELLRRLDKTVLKHRPDMVVVFIGGNDFLDGTPRDQFMEHLDQVVGRIAATGARMVLVEVPTGIVWDPYAGIYRRVAARHGAILVPETQLRLWFSAELLVRDYLASPLTIDGIHLSPAGAKRVADWLEPYVLKGLAQTGRRARSSAPG